MKETGMPFSSDMVRAILEGRKSQTRRMIKLPDAPNHLGQWEPTYLGGDGTTRDSRGVLVPRVDGIWHTRTGKFIKCPYGGPGDRLWVRETHFRWGYWAKNGLSKTGKQKWTFKALNKEIAFPDFPPTLLHDNQSRNINGWFKRPSIFMPRWASRILLEITDVRAERLNQMTESDAHLEGVGNLVTFMLLWDRLNKKRGYEWKSNCWVWVITFKLCP